MENKILTEVGIEYTRDKLTAEEKGWPKFRYSRQSPYAGTITEKFIYCRNKDCFNILVKHWNSLLPKWNFKEIK